MESSNNTKPKRMEALNKPSGKELMKMMLNEKLKAQMAK